MINAKELPMLTAHCASYLSALSASLTSAAQAKVSGCFSCFSGNDSQKKAVVLH